LLRKLPFRTRLVLVVSVPLLVLVGFAGFTIKDRFDALGAQQQFGSLVGPFEALTQVSRAVSDQAVVASNPDASNADLRDARRASRAATDTLMAKVPQLADATSARTRRAVSDVVNRLVEEVEVPQNLTAIGGSALAAASRVAREVEDSTLATSLLAIVDLRRQQLAIAQEATVVIEHLAGGSPDITRWITAITEQGAQARLFAETANAAERSAYEVSGTVNVPKDPVHAAVGAGLPTEFPSVTTTSAEYRKVYEGKQVAADRGVTAVQDVVNAEADHRQSETRGVAIVVALGTAAVIWMALMLIWALVHSVSKPLRALTRSAREVSERRLPLLVDTLHRGGDLESDALGDLSPIRVESKDEIGELAKAFNTIQEVTVTVAREQSEFLKKGIGDLYVNLARRNQSLLDRQISLIDDLEASADPDELASLFELDHLATRMRRNAESLLVLSGAEQPRHWGSSVPVVDVVRAAAAEIADFARLHAHGFEGDVAVVGHAVADLTHLVAELLENATAFSPPETPVTVGGRMLDQRFVIGVTDRGIGMDEPRIAAANALLARPPAPGLALSRTLGLHVVAHLAARHGIHVQLRAASPTGLTALVVLPPTLLASGHEAPETEPVAAPDAIPVHEAPVADEPEREPVAVGVATAPFTHEAAAVTATNVANGADNGLTARVPGTHLTHFPSDTAASNGEARPRPEGVHDMLSRHERGKRDGHGQGAS
jgi:HAMP domain-containing protein/anti-sigma regulatory factor (Ser/Thr protein kinase)